MQVEGEAKCLHLVETGGRVRNTYATYPLQRNSPEKLGLIPHGIILRHLRIIKVQAVKDGRAAH